MKQFILYLFILLPFCVNSQVNETFDGPMLGADWIGKDRGQFVVNADGRLQLNIKPTESGTASISERRESRLTSPDPVRTGDTFRCRKQPAVCRPNRCCHPDE